jgi:hypothetical protein
MSADIIKVGKEETTTYYSENYLKEQIEKAYKAGMIVGREQMVQFHSISPQDEIMEKNLINLFFENIETEFKKRFENNEVWKICSNREILNHKKYKIDD